MATAVGPDDDQTLKEVEAYVKKYNIQQVLKDSIVQLCLQKPESPFGFLKDYFAKLEKVTSTVIYVFFKLFLFFF